jgi:sulfur carrier protein
MQIIVNGKPVDCAERQTLKELLVELGFVPEAIIVERNAEIVQRSEYTTTVITDGDNLTLIEFVGGG